MMRRLAAAWRAFRDPYIATDKACPSDEELRQMKITFRREFYLQVEGKINDLQKCVRALAVRVDE